MPVLVIFFALLIFVPGYIVLRRIFRRREAKAAMP
jgi:hypothetical protein